jgi:hypothetical protein
MEIYLNSDAFNLKCNMKSILMPNSWLMSNIDVFHVSYLFPALLFTFNKDTIKSRSQLLVYNTDHFRK